MKLIRFLAFHNQAILLVGKKWIHLPLLGKRIENGGRQDEAKVIYLVANFFFVTQ